MSNKEIAGLFKELAALMEYHGENAFKIRSYQTAYNNFRRIEAPLIDMDAEALSQLPGVGQAIASKLLDIQATGSFATLERFRANTPQGIQELLKIRGIGPKKLKVLIESLEISSPGELLYACQENRLVGLKGFGVKTQASISEALSYHQESRGKLLYRDAHHIGVQFEEICAALRPHVELVRVGDMGTKEQIVEKIQYACASDLQISQNDRLEILEEDEDVLLVRLDDIHEIEIILLPPDEFVKEAFKLRGDSDLTEAILDLVTEDDVASEEDLFDLANISFIPAECRQHDLAEAYHDIEELVESDDIQGIVHNHSTWSDGSSSIAAMAERCMSLGYSYFGISDHSQSAFYANGLKPDRVVAQWDEIDALNEELATKGFRVLKGIESDILSDGRLDYEDDILAGFDFVVASVHSQLKMDEAKATSRLIKAIENPYTSILGHMTGRLLLSRKGYPVDHAKVIDACAANGVHIELNANPLRLDMDWTWIPYALEKSVKISINPDAHSLAGISDVDYGLIAARKGLLTRDACLNALSCDEFVKQCTRY